MWIARQIRMRSRSIANLLPFLLILSGSSGLDAQEAEFATAAELARHQLEQGLRALDSGDVEEAERLLLLSVRSLDGPHARLALSRLYSDQGRLQESLRAAEYAVRRSVGDPEILRRAQLFRTRAAAMVNLKTHGRGVCDQLSSPMGSPWSDAEREELIPVASYARCVSWLQEHAEARPEAANRWRMLLEALEHQLRNANDSTADERQELIKRYLVASRDYSERFGDRDTLLRVSWSLLGMREFLAWAHFLDSLDDGGEAWWHYRAAHLAYADRDGARALAHLSQAYGTARDENLLVGLRIGFRMVCRRMSGSEWSPAVCSELPEAHETWLRLAEIAPGSVFSALPATASNGESTSEAWRRLAERQPASLLVQPP